jgi:hypothetical protein
MTLNTLEAAGHPPPKFVIRDMQNNCRRFHFEQGIKRFGLRNGPGKSIEQPTIALLPNPLKHHRNHDLIRNVFATLQKRARFPTEFRAIAKGAP